METRKIVKLDPQLSENEHKFRRPQNRGTNCALGGSGPQSTSHHKLKLMEFPHYNHAISLNDFSFFPQQASTKIAEEFTVFKTTEMIRNKNKKYFSC